MTSYKNIFISKLNEKNVNNFTSDIGLFMRRKSDRPFKKLCNIFTNATIIRAKDNQYENDEEYFANLNTHKIPISSYPISKKAKANNIVLERYPKLNENEGYIFVGNHTCPEDIETMINIIDRNVYLILGSVESLKYNPETYLSWLNGMIVFDILDRQERSGLIPKMERVLRTQSILIYPEGSHNYDFNKLIKPIYDGAVNLALKTGKSVVPITMLKDYANRISYIDVGTPINMQKIHLNAQKYFPGKDESEKYRIKSMSSFLRDKMATSVYFMMERHFEPIKRREYQDIEGKFIEEYVKDTFEKLKWKHDVFEAEYLTKKTNDEQEYEDIVCTLANLKLSKKTISETLLNNREFVQKRADLERKNVPANMRKRYETLKTKGKN